MDKLQHCFFHVPLYNYTLYITPDHGNLWKASDAFLTYAGYPPPPPTKFSGNLSSLGYGSVSFTPPDTFNTEKNINSKAGHQENVNDKEAAGYWFCWAIQEVLRPL